MGQDIRLALYLFGFGTLIGGAATFGVISFMHMVLRVNPGSMSGPIGIVVMFATIHYGLGAVRIAKKDAPR